MTTPADNAARLEAALPSSSNIIVEAGAGTGKTTLLINRLCYLILGEDIAIDKIVALTFTDKAAAEIKMKLLAKMQVILTQLAAPKPDDEATLTLLNHYKKDKEILINKIQETFELAERAQICTIHSFCLRLLRRFPLEAGLTPKMEVDSDGSITQNIFDKEWAAFLERELILENKQAAAWQNLLEFANIDDLKAYAFTLLNPALEDFSPTASFSKLAEVCKSYGAEAVALSTAYLDDKERAIEKSLAIAASSLFESANFFANFTKTNKKKSKFKIDKLPSSQPKNWPDDDFEKAISIIKFAIAVNVENQALILAAHRILSPFAAAVKTKIQGENYISYDNLIYSTRNLLKNNTYVRKELKAEYKSILIDEFQDTDPMQGEILLFLCEEDSPRPATTWSEIKLAKGKLFVVGDPKQSIYRFRGADITAYEKFTDLMAAQGAKKLFLRSNFRSSKQIVAYANVFGKNAILETKGIQPKYEAIEHTKTFAAPSVNMVLIDNGDAKMLSEEARHNQAQYIAAWIRENAYKTKLASGKPMAYKDIAILLRTSTALDKYIDALKRFDIKYTVEETKNFYQAQEVLDIINILKVLNDPSDKTALIGVLRGPFSLLEDAQILELANQNMLSINATAPNKRAAEIFKMLRALHYKAQTLPLDELISELVYNTPLLELEALATQKEQAIANIFKFLAGARLIHGRNAVSLSQFLAYSENYAKKQDKEGESPLAEESLDTVRVMTMHKAKGLEFPVVILTDISKVERNTSAKQPDFLVDWANNIKGLRAGNNLQDAAFAYLEALNHTHHKAEELRIIYVALTRAKEQLLLVGNLKEEKTSINAALQLAGCSPSSAGKPKNILEGDAKTVLTYPLYKDSASFVDNQFFNQTQNAVKFDIPAWKAAWQSRQLAFETAAAKKIALTPSGQNEQNAIEENQPAMQDNSAAIIGTLCHQMVFDLFTNKLRPLATQAFIAGVDPIAHKSELEEAAKIIKTFKESELFKELKNMELLAAEMPFTFLENGAVINGIMDAVFKDKNGKIFIIDYKSDNINLTEAKEHSLKYKPQLALYTAAARKMFKNAEIESAIVYLRNATIFKIDLN
ncbi:MAG: UvrD-helicase domain-containing protein [Elusimicrobiota bacterium]|jgi:ATP-dependent helicase/nuclease subunit A|nr:UvrD-helicase domain-containing protein [Elusimicrobiota bacterium]